ncbi:MAG: hypothetical protein AB8G95_02145 [Anaerolineae bacterium]
MNVLLENPILIALLLIFFGTLTYNIYSKQRTKEEYECPKCQSHDVIETGHTTKQSRTVMPTGAGTPAGGDVRLQLDMKLDLRCKNCGNGFKRDVTRTY